MQVGGGKGGLNRINLFLHYQFQNLLAGKWILILAQLISQACEALLLIKKTPRVYALLKTDLYAKTYAFFD